MLGAERLLGDRERAAGERLGPGPAALLGVDERERDQRRDHVGMVGAQPALTDGEGALGELCSVST